MACTTNYHPHAQGKLVRVVQGEVFDVAVDIRKSSPSFGQWVGEILSAENKKLLWVPEGFAHGFLTLSDTAEFLYKTTNYYNPESEHCICWDDEQTAIKWPVIPLEFPIAISPKVSEKDCRCDQLNSAYIFDN